MRRAPPVLVLLLSAFFVLVATIGLAGWQISSDARDVRSQTTEIMDNGLQSVLSAQQFRISLLRMHFSLLERAEGDDRDSLGNLFVLEREFWSIWNREWTAPLHFAGEVEDLSKIRSDFEAALRTFPGPGARDQWKSGEERRAVLAVLRVRRDCIAWERLNQQGMHQAEQDLRRISRNQQKRLIETMLATAVASCLLSLSLARSIGIPLVRLTRAVERLPERQAGAQTPPHDGWPVAREIEGLSRAFFESVRLLGDRDRQLESARQALVDANASLDRQVQVKTAALEATNARLLEVNAELDRRDRAKTVFIATISHELRSPLTVIKGGALTLGDQRGQLEPEVEKSLLSAIAEEADHLAEVVNDLLDAARMEAGTFRIAPEADVDLADLVDRVAGSLKTLFMERAIKLEASVEEPFPMVTADRQRLRQILRNLLENAGKYAPEGSTVRVRLAAIERDQLPARVEISVADRGEALEPEDWPRLFTPFVAGGEGTIPTGTGLGLAIAKELVEAHGGRIGVRKEPGEGKAFWFWLPLSGQESPVHIS